MNRSLWRRQVIVNLVAGPVLLLWVEVCVVYTGGAVSLCPYPLNLVLMTARTVKMQVSGYFRMR